MSLTAFHASAPGHGGGLGNRPRSTVRSVVGIPETLRPGTTALRRLARFIILASAGLAATSQAQVLGLPTANNALFEPDGAERFLVGTEGKPWPSGTYGCVRTDGRQMHEGLDIRTIARDKRGEPTDPILATTSGVVAYVNRQPGLSNYGIYIVCRHQVDGVELYSLYAHLSEIRSGIRAGVAVAAGEQLGTMGRTSNTRQSITQERAHLHFELNLLINERFDAWHQKSLPGQKNDHGVWNGRNFLGIDPGGVLYNQHTLGNQFSLRHFLQTRAELCRVAVRAVDFPWLRRYAPLVLSNPVAQQEGIAGYELVLDFTGLPFQVIPRPASQLPARGKITLLSVNEPEQTARPCRHLVVKKGDRWELSRQGHELLDLILF